MFSIYYMAATWMQSWRLSVCLKKIKEVRRKKGSIILHQEIPPYVYMVRSGSCNSKIEVKGVLSKSCSNHNISNIKDLVWFSSNRKILTIFPEQELDISSWITVIPGKTHLPLQFDGSLVCLNPERILMLLEADYHTCQFEFCSGPPLQIEKFGVPIAWHVSEHMSLLFETDEAKLSALCVTFMQRNIKLENGIEIIRIMSVKVTGSPYCIQNVKTVPETYAPIDPALYEEERRERFMSRWRAHVSMLATFCEAVEQVLPELAEISVRHPGSGVGAVRLVPSSEVPAVRAAAAAAASEVASAADSDASLSETGPPAPSPVPMSVHDSTQDTEADSVSALSTDTVLHPDSSRVSCDLSVDGSLAPTPGMTPLTTPSATPRRERITSARPSPARQSAPSRPPNIVVFSDSPSSSDAVQIALDSSLTRDRYTIHQLPCSALGSGAWMEEATLVVVHGDVPAAQTPHLLRFLLRPSSVSPPALFVLCSDLLGAFLPIFQTAEVRPNELVRCSYKEWKHVPLVHHVFCYQPSPPAPHHFQNDDHHGIPDRGEIEDESGNKYELKVEVLGVEETWRTPSLLLVTIPFNKARIIFSQVHLEVEPGLLVSDEERRLALETSDKARHQILKDLLGLRLGLSCSPDSAQPSIKYTPAYFLGDHERKQAVMSHLTDGGWLDSSGTLRISDNLTLKLCGKGATPPPATSSLLPLLVHACPASFSTVEYYECLKTESLGRLVIFTEVMTSSMEIIKGPPLAHGLAIIPLYQTQGKGRGSNSWLSPAGSAMFTAQLHIPLKSQLGSSLSLLQHIISLAVVSAICDTPGLQEIDIGLKWPNDIYANGHTKLGGVLASSTITGDTAICNVGCGLNLSNQKPTMCVNDMIEELAASGPKGKRAGRLSHEQYFASVFNKLEKLLTLAQSPNTLDQIFNMYYAYWLHSDAAVRVMEGDKETEVVLKGIDRSGFLVGEAAGGRILTLDSDGNSFDMMRGLIVPRRL